MVVGEICCVQTSCTILSELHSICYYSIWPNTTVFSQFPAILGMRPHRRWVFIVVSHSLCKDWFHACQKITPYFINHEIWHKTVNLNSLEINRDHFPSMLSPKFRLSGGSLGYWTACNNFKRYCTLPYCGHCFYTITKHSHMNGCNYECRYLALLITMYMTYTHLCNAINMPTYGYL